MDLSPVAFGYLPDPPDARDYEASSLALEEAPESFDARGLVAEVLNQHTLASCVAQSVCGALRARQWYEDGRDVPPLVSRFFVWWHARNAHQAARLNSGTYIRYAIKVLNALGRPSEHLWPHVLSDLSSARPIYTKKPSATALTHAQDQRVAEYHRVDELDAERVARIKQLVAARRFVVFGTDVATSFVPATGPSYNVPPPLRDTIAGGHAMFIVGYDAKGAWVVNSWGKHWRDGGMIHLSWEYLAWARTRDLWAISLRQP
jgi:C1A family cysteine protease